LGSVILSFVLWLTFAYQSGTVVYRNYEVPIEYRNLQSSSVALQDSVPLQARITLSGSEQAFRTFDETSLVISFDLASENLYDEELTVTVNDLNLPTDLNFFEASPPTLKLKPKRLSRLKMPIKITTSGQLRSGLQMISITAEPSTVEFLADTTATLPDSIATDLVDLSSIQNSATIQKRLQFDQNKLKLPEQASPQVYIKIEVKKI
jgi:YbbR domain-containing protein